MSTTDSRQASDIEHDIEPLRIETLRDDELNAVTGGSYKDLQEVVNAPGNFVKGVVSAVVAAAGG